MLLKSYMKHLAMFTSVLALSVFLCTGAASAAPFQNGSFELGIITPTGDRPYWEELPIGATNITGWAVTAGNVDYYMEPGWTAQDGTRSVDLNGREAGAIAQTFDTVAGGQYLVTFALAGNPGYPQGTKTVRVSAGGTTQDYTFDTTGKGGTSMGWVDNHFYFTAQGDTTTLTFTSLTPGSAQGPALDDVRVLPDTIGDDFNDNIKDKTFWGPDYKYHNGVLKEQNQRLGYIVSTPSRNYEYTFRPMITSRGPYTSDWEVQIDLFNGTKPSKNNQDNSFGISVIECGNDNNEIYAELYSTHFGGAPSRKGFHAELWTEDVESGWADTSSLSLSDPLTGTVRLSFDSVGKVFRTYYDTGGGWQEFGSFGVSDAAGGGDGNGDWTMADTDQFCIAVYGYSEHMAIAKGKMYGDNFQATGVTTPLKTRIVNPNGAEIVPAGELYTVEWDAPIDAIKFKLKYSLDNGYTWKAMVPGFVTGKSYDWQVPLPSKDKRRCRVRVDAYWIGYNGNDQKIGKDVSDAPFTIDVP